MNDDGTCNQDPADAEDFLEQLDRLARENVIDVRKKMNGEFAAVELLGGYYKIEFRTSTTTVAIVHALPKDRARDLCSILNDIFLNHLTEVEPLTDERLQELIAVSKDLDDTTRYVVFKSQLGHRSFVDFERDGYAMVAHEGTVLRRLWAAKDLRTAWKLQYAGNLRIARGDLTEAGLDITDWDVE